MANEGYVGDFNSMAKGDNIAWIWIVQTIYNLIRHNQYNEKVKGSYFNPDDIAQDTIYYLLEYKKKKGVDIAMKIYEGKKVGYLLKIIRMKIDERNGVQYFDTPIDFSRYKRIHEVCRKYNISEEPCNAHIISHIINEFRVFSIEVVANLLAKKKPLNVSYELLFEELPNDHM